MLHKIPSTALIFSLVLLLAACGGDKKDDKEGKGDLNGGHSQAVEMPDTVFSEVNKDIFITAAKAKPGMFEGAALMLEEPKDGAQLEAGQYTFNFSTKNFEFGQQTDDPLNDQLASSAKGQHIHFILNNLPYTAHYEPAVQKELPPGTHVVLAFLARSYHYSVKNPNSLVVRKITVGEPGENDSLADFNSNDPHLFYSRPKGTYAGEGNIEKVLVDFWLMNADLSPDGYKVRLTINGEHKFMLTHWQGYIMHGLPPGEHTIQLELLNKEGKLVESPFNPSVRKFTLKKDAA